MKPEPDTPAPPAGLPPGFTIVSGGQTGADRAALDWAIAHGVPHGGWCPRGRLAENGPIPGGYRLRETPSGDGAQRTTWNVRDSDGTVVFSLRPELHGGSAFTLEMARNFHKPHLHLPSRLGPEQAAAQLRQFIRTHRIRRLNCAGPRASQEPGVGRWVWAVLQTAFPSSSKTPAAEPAPTQSDPTPGRSTDMLCQLWRMQRALNERIGVPTGDLTQDQKIEWILNYCRAMSQEIAELTDSVPWKWWARYQKFDEQNARVEVVDLFHFLISLAQVLGMSAEDVFQAYLKKNEVNFQRQESGYKRKDHDDSRHI